MRTVAAITTLLPVMACCQELSGTLRIWGDRNMQDKAAAWQSGFQKLHAGVRFETRLLGTDTGMAGLYTGVADIALMSRPATPKEIMAFEWVRKYKPVALPILPSPPIAVFVHKQNPIERLTLDQLENIVRCDVPRPARTWGDLGLKAPWAERPIHIYVPDADSDTASIFRDRVLHGSRKWNWENIREFPDEGGREILDSLALDPDGIALSYMSAANENVKAVATLSRSVYAYIDRDPQKPIDPKVDAFLHYIQAHSISGTIRCWGNDEMAALLTAWENGFRKHHPDIRFEDRLMGPASAMAGIYTSVADLSLMGHELLKEESMAFEWVFRYKAMGMEVATASLNVHGNNANIAVFVHKDNPLTQLTLAQLDAIYGAEHKRSGGNIRTWGDLGLTGEWADKPIHPYGYSPDSEAGIYFRQRVLNDSFKWNPDLHDLPGNERPDGKIVDAGPRILEALANDRYGIAYAKTVYSDPRVKTIALAESGTAVAPGRKEIEERTYPLTRAMKIYLNRDPDKPLDPKIKEFLRYILSPEGQASVAAEGGYFPLPAKIVQQELQKLE